MDKTCALAEPAPTKSQYTRAIPPHGGFSSSLWLAGVGIFPPFHFLGDSLTSVLFMDVYYLFLAEVTGDLIVWRETG